MRLSHIPGREDQLGVDVLVHRPADCPTAIAVHIRAVRINLT